MTNPLDLHAYADDQLAAEERKRFEGVLAEDPATQAALANVQDTKKLLGNLPAVECRGEWQRCRDRLKEIDQVSRVEGWVGRYAWGLCGAFFLFIVMGGVMQRQSGDTVQSADLARIATSLPGGAREAAPSPRLSRELDAILKSAAESIDPNRMQILSGAKGVVDGRPAVRLTLRDAYGNMALLVMPGELNFEGMDPLESNPASYSGKMGRLNCVAWKEGGRTLVLLGERGAEGLAAAAARIEVR